MSLIHTLAADNINLDPVTTAAGIKTTPGTGAPTAAGQASELAAIQRLAPVTLGASTDRTFNGTSAQSGALTGTLIRVIAKSADCRILIGSNPTALATSTLIVAGVPEYFAITSSHVVAAIRDASTDGTLNITICG